MSGIAGSQWFSWEIIPVLDAAYQEASRQYFARLDGTQDAELARWRKAFGDVAAVRVEANSLADAEQYADNPTLYRSISPFWQRVDAVIKAIGTPAVMGLVAALPRDPDAGASNLKQLAIGVGLVGAVVGAFLYVHR